MLENSNLLLIQTVEDFPESEWDKPGASGKWSVKDVVSHLTYYQHVLVDILHSVQGIQPTPYLTRWLSTAKEVVNNEAVESRGGATAQQILKEYDETQAEAIELLQQLPPALIEQQGTLSWYGPDRSLTDLIRGIYSHTQHHCEEIAALRERLAE